MTIKIVNHIYFVYLFNLKLLTPEKKCLNFKIPYELTY